MRIPFPSINPVQSGAKPQIFRGYFRKIGVARRRLAYSPIDIIITGILEAGGNSCHSPRTEAHQCACAPCFQSFLQALPAHKRGYQAVNQEQFSPLVHIHQRGVRRVCVAVQAVRDAAQMVTANVHNLPFASNFHADRRNGIKTTGLPGLQ